jgi:general secretion pathway protein L
VVTDGKGLRGKRLQGSAIERQGVAPLSDLSGTIANAERIVVLLAAVDVALLRVKVPPLSPAKLKAALPNLVEDQLIGDPAGCVIAADGTEDGLVTIAVLQRAWFGLLNKTLVELGARHIAALPAQLCLANHSGQPGQPEQPVSPGSVAAAINGQESGIDVTIRLSEHHGIGLTIAPGHEDQSHDAQQSTAHETIRAILAVAPDAPISLYVPQAEVQTYQQAASDIALAHPGTGNRVSVLADDWAHWIAGAQSAALDLMAGRAVRRLDWRPWRWPLALAAAVLLVNIIALNFDWWRKQSEANALRASMTRIYKAAYPKETVIMDPIAQIRQKIAAAKRNAGLPSPDDFVALAAAFGEAAAGAMPGRTATSIGAIEYRERSLIVQLKPGIEAPTQQLKTLLAERNLSLELAPAQGGAVAWQIRNMK